MSFPNLDNFKANEFSHPDMMDSRVLELLDKMVSWVKLKHPSMVFIVHSDYRPGDPKWHGKGKAVDGHFMNRFTKENMPVLQQFCYAMWFTWSGVGFYPYWNRPGIHVDLRPRTLLDPMKTWWRDEQGNYRNVFEYPDLRMVIR
jgi:hypothetical protein